MLTKPKRYVNKSYKEYIKQQPCCVTSLITLNPDTGKIESDPHHVKSVGSGGSDLTQIPLIHELHQECHKIGSATFQEKYSVDFTWIRLRLLEKYIEETS